MAEPEDIIIGTYVYPNDMVDEFDHMFCPGRIAQIALPRRKPYMVEFSSGDSDWFDAEELDITYPPPPHPARSGRALTQI